jgi:hypothetical protein
MKKYLIPFLFFAAGLLGAQSPEDLRLALEASRREVFVVLDISGSMEWDNKFVNVQDYLEREVVDSLLKTGDDFTLVTFGDSASERFRRNIASGADKGNLKAELRALRPDNDYTDIGAALETLAEILEKREEAGVRRVILFITDGLNAPPPGSKYRGADITRDPRYRALGERISQGNWFLYVIGIGGRTAAGDIAGLIPGADLQTTGADLSGLDAAGRIREAEASERAEAERLAAEDEARRREEELARGVMGFLRALAARTGLPLPALAGVSLLILAFLVFALVFLVRAFKTRELVITDEQETLIRRIPGLGGITLNSPSAILPGIGNENSQVFRIQRGFAGIKVQTLDSRALADNSPYKKTGTRPLKGVIGLANGRLVRVTVR